MDVSKYLDPKIAPRAVFDSLDERKELARFKVPVSTTAKDQPTEYRTVTWGAFADQIRDLALYLAGAGLQAGDRAAIFAPNRVEWMSAALAIQAAGGVMVPIYPASTSKQAGYVARHSDAKVVFVDTQPLLARLIECFADLSSAAVIVLLDDALDVAAAYASVQQKKISLEEISAKIVRLDAARAKGKEAHARDPGAFERRMNAVDLDQPGLMLYTSGTSGEPKGVPLSHRNVAANGKDWLVCNAPLLDERATDLLWLPMSHIFGFGEACLGNTLGFTTYLADPTTVIAKLPEVKPRVFMSVPAVWEKLATAAMSATEPEKRRAKLREVTGGNLRFCLSGGAGLKREVKELFYDAGMLLIEGYGLTETAPTLTLNRPDAFRFDSVGKPLPSVELKLADDGEILARGPNVFRGYHKDPDATRGAFTEDGWFKTGDVGRFTEDGFLQIIDRKKDILVTAGGKNVPPQNIELRFADDALFMHVLVYGDGKRYLTAGVWVNHDVARVELGKEPDESELRALVERRIERVNAELASFETIKRFAIMKEPLTVAGGHLTATLKVKRKHVVQAFRDAFEALYA